MGSQARRPAPLRRAGHAHPRPARRADRLGPLRAADRRRLPQVVSEAAALERRVPVREVLAGRGRAADPDASRSPPVLAGRDALGLAIARSLAIADQLLEESASWLWIGGRIPDTSGRTSRGEALLERYRAELGELAGEPRPDVTEPGGVAPAAHAACRRRAARPARDRHPGRPRPGRRGPMTGRRAALVAVLFATLVAALAPAAAAPALAAGPGMTIVSNATYTVDPDHGVVHVAVEPHGGEPPDRHEDPALLLRQGVPRGPAEHGRVQGQRPDRRADRPRRREDGRPHAAPDRLRVAARIRPGAGHGADVRHQGPGRRADADDAGRDEPRRVRGVGRTPATGRPAARSRSSSRRATRSTPDRTCSTSRRPTATAGRSTRPARSPSR